MASKTELQIVINAKDKASKRFKGLAKTLKGVGLIGGVAFGAIAAGIGVAVKEFANFEQGMSQVKAITGATGRDFEDLTKLAKKMGRTTAFTAKEATEAMTFLGMAGFDTEEIMAGLAGTLNLASAANIELGRAADITSNVLTGFQLEAKETDRVVDVLAKTITSSNTNMEQLGEAMKFLAPSAAAFGISIEEASAVVGILGNAGLQGSIATRALTTALTRLAKPTNAMLDTMEKLNLNFFDSAGEFIGLIGLVEQLEKGFVGLTTQQRQAAIATLFGAQSIKQINVLMSASSAQIAEFTKELQEAGGTADKMAQIQLDNLKGSFTLLKSAISGVLIDLGEKFAPIIRGVADGLTGLTTKVEELGGVNGILVILKNKLVDVLDFIDEKTLIITFLKEAFNNVVESVKTFLIPAFQDLWDELKDPAVAEFLKAIGTLLVGALLAVIRIIEGVLVGLIFALTSGMKLAAAGVRVFATAWDEVTEAVEDFIAKIIEAIDWIKKIPSKIGNFGGVVKQIPGAFADLFRAGGGPVNKGGSFVVGERGPEVFTPSRDGSIIPNHRLGGLGGVTINITGNSFLTDEEGAKKIGDMIIQTLQLNTRLA